MIPAGTVTAWADAETPAVKKAKAQKACVTFYKALDDAGLGKFHEGKKLSTAELPEYGLAGLDLPEGTEVALLGSGSTAWVFRITPTSGHSYLLKQYKIGEGHREGSREAEYARDREALKNFKAANRHDAKDTFEIPDVKANDAAHRLEMADFRGFCVEVIAGC